MAGKGFDVTSFSPSYQNKILTGLLGAAESAMEKVFGIENTKQQSGEIPFQPSKYSVANSSNSEKTKIAIDAVAESADSALDSASFSINAKYAKRGSVHAMQVDSLADATSDDIVTMTGQNAVAKVQGAIDIDGSAYLKSVSVDGVTVNQDINATAVWSDSVNAKPFTDLDAMFDAIGGGGLRLWLGLDRARELASLPAIRSEFHNFAGANGRLTMQGLAEALLMHYGDMLDGVMIDGNEYNSANLAASGVYARIFDGVVWLGAPEHMMVVENQGRRKFRTWFDEDTDTYYSELVRYLTFASGETKRSAVMRDT